MIMFNAATSNDRLLLFIGGTWSQPKNYETITEYVREEGFHVINLAYLNNIPAAPLGEYDDPTVYSDYRQEICFGTPLSAHVEVDSLNSIDRRFYYALNYLADQKEEQGWGSFIEEDGTPRWSKITVAGHSQGAGHAGYLAKKIAVDRVVMFAGPNDYSTFYDESGDWLSIPSATNTTDYFALLHAEDDVASYSNQVANLRALDMLGALDTTVRIETESAPNFGNYQAFHTELDVLSTHSAIANSKWYMSSFWTYLFDL
jgi:pimeloyl-ACP methyl ester carboxylesterase